MPFRLGVGEILVILAVAMLIFGPTLITRMGKLGKSVKGGVDNFREASGLSDDEDDDE